MKILCRTLLEHLVNNGQLFQNLKSFLLFGTAKGGKVVLPKTSLVAAMTLAVRPVIETNFIEKTVSLFLLHILSVPGLVDHLEQMASIEILNGALFHEEYRNRVCSVKKDCKSFPVSREAFIHWTWIR